MEQKKFYESLHTESKLQLGLLPVAPHPIVSEETRELLNRPLTLDDLFEAMAAMPSNKIPGLDGLSVKTYKIFWDIIGTHLYNARCESVDEEVLHPTARMGIITLLPKPNKDTSLLTNWRPLTMLNNDYKIITKALSNRMKFALEEIIHEDQVGFLKGWYIGENLSSLNTALQCINMHNKEAILVSFDFEKAFDTGMGVEQAGLSHFDFGEYMEICVDTIYQDSMACVQNNG